MNALETIRNFNENTRGGVAMTWILIIVLVFILGAVYLLFSNPWDMLYSRFEPNLTADQKATAHKLNNVWITAPIILILVIVIAGVIKTMGGSSDTGFM